MPQPKLVSAQGLFNSTTFIYGLAHLAMVNSHCVMPAYGRHLLNYLIIGKNYLGWRSLGFLLQQATHCFLSHVFQYDYRILPQHNRYLPDSRSPAGAFNDWLGAFCALPLAGRAADHLVRRPQKARGGNASQAVTCPCGTSTNNSSGSAVHPSFCPGGCPAGSRPDCSDCCSSYRRCA